MQIYWGDIHNHNEIGYGKGSLERSFDIANSLDFYAFTPHTWIGYVRFMFLIGESIITGNEIINSISSAEFMTDYCS